MATFAYDILVRRTKNDKPQWVLASNPDKSFGSNLYKLLNGLGKKGWEVVTAGDFGWDARSEIIIKQQTS